MARLTIDELNELKALRKKEREEGVPELKDNKEVEVILDPTTLDATEEKTSEENKNETPAFFPHRNKRRNSKPRTDKETVSDLNGLLWMIHKGLAELTGIEEFALDATESEELSKAIARVQAFYPDSRLSPITMAWAGLFITTGEIYGTRIIAYTKKKKNKPKPQVVEIPLPPGTQSSEQVQ